MLILKNLKAFLGFYEECFYYEIDFFQFDGVVLGVVGNAEKIAKGIDKMGKGLGIVKVVQNI